MEKMLDIFCGIIYNKMCYFVGNKGGLVIADKAL